MMFLETLNLFLAKVLFIALPLELMSMLIGLIDISKSKFHGNDKIIWVFDVVFSNVVGTLLYFTLGTNQKIKI